MTPLRTMREAQRENLARRRMGDVVAVKQDGAAAAGNKPEIAFRVVVLPAPLAPIRATSWPRPTVSDTPFTAVTLP